MSQVTLKPWGSSFPYQVGCEGFSTAPFLPSQPVSWSAQVTCRAPRRGGGGGDDTDSGPDPPLLYLDLI